MSDDASDKQKYEKHRILQLRAISHRISLCLSSKSFKLSVENPWPVIERMRLAPHQLAETMLARVSIASLIRRYRAIHLVALQESIAIVLDSKSLEEAHQRLTERAKKLGMAHKQSQQKKAMEAQEKRLKAISPGVTTPPPTTTKPESVSDEEADFYTNLYGATSD
jgi:hypothetical protein